MVEWSFSTKAASRPLDEKMAQFGQDVVTDQRFDERLRYLIISIDAEYEELKDRPKSEFKKKMLKETFDRRKMAMVYGYAHATPGSDASLFKAVDQGMNELLRDAMNLCFSKAEDETVEGLIRDILMEADSIIARSFIDKNSSVQKSYVFQSNQPMGYGGGTGIDENLEEAIIGAANQSWDKKHQKDK